MILFLSTDYAIIDSRLGRRLNLEFSLNHVEEVITTNSKADSFIRDLCVAKGIDFRIYDLALRHDSKSIEMLCKDIDKIVLLSSMNNSFYHDIFREAESWVVFPDGFRASLPEVKKVLKSNYKKRLEEGKVNSYKAYNEEIEQPLRNLGRINIVILDKGR